MKLYSQPVQFIQHFFVLYLFGRYNAGKLRKFYRKLHSRSLKLTGVQYGINLGRSFDHVLSYGSMEGRYRSEPFLPSHTGGTDKGNIHTPLRKVSLRLASHYGKVIHKAAGYKHRNFGIGQKKGDLYGIGYYGNVFSVDEISRYSKASGGSIYYNGIPVRNQRGGQLAYFIFFLIIYALVKPSP